MNLMQTATVCTLARGYRFHVKHSHQKGDVLYCHIKFQTRGNALLVVKPDGEYTLSKEV